MKNYTLQFDNGRIKHFFLIAISALLVFTGCKKDDDEPVRYTNIKFVHAIPDAGPMDVYLDGNRRSENVAFGTSTEYYEVTAGSHKIDAYAAGTNTNPLTINQGFDGDARFSVFAINTSAQKQALVVPDTVASPGSTQAWVRYVNLSSGGQAYYLSLEGGAQQFPSKEYKGVSNYKPFNPGTIDLDVINPSTAAVVVDAEAFNFEGGKIYTLILSGSAANSTLNLKSFPQ
jgi:hypothetical protein